ncbi:MAG TPA: FAD binding domain-containing protein [Myxococcota bacterium]|nr:FAD binding domain-containing protein [Myxococcota bacterium]
MIHFPQQLSDLAALSGEFRAGATDLAERRRHHISTGDLIDLRDLPGLDGLLLEGPRLNIGAKVTVQAVADSPLVRSHHPALAASAGVLATPAIRAVATVGGNLTQRVRCWYYRSPEQQCLKKGGTTCLARAGDHLYHACFDRGACVAPHASTLAMALLMGDVVVLTNRRSLSVAEFLGDGTDARRENRLEAGELITGLSIPVVQAGLRAGYHRAISRARAEWPLVEAAAQLRVEGGVLRQVQLVLGGVATVPFRLPAVEAKLEGMALDLDQIRTALNGASQGASPLPMTGYKLELLAPTLFHAVRVAVEAS